MHPFIVNIGEKKPHQVFLRKHLREQTKQSARKTHKNNDNSTEIDILLPSKEKCEVWLSLDWLICRAFSFFHALPLHLPYLDFVLFLFLRAFHLILHKFMR